MAIPKNTEFTDTAGVTANVSERAGRLAPHGWQRRACGIGAKGFRVYDWALLDSDFADHRYLIRRSINDGELAFYHCYDPRREGFGELVRGRWCPLADRGMFRSRQRRCRSGQLSSPALSRLVSARHPGDARARLSRRLRPQTQEQKGDRGHPPVKQRTARSTIVDALSVFDDIGA
jgi:hypothetical protein